jgi:hypothetical protein
MGGAACQIIITDGNIAYGVVNTFAENFPVNVNYLKAALNASCQGTLHASLYLNIQEDYISSNITNAIIASHQRVLTELPVFSGTLQEAQTLVDEIATEMHDATKELIDILE